MKTEFVKINEEVVDQLNEDLQKLHTSLSAFKNSGIRNLILPEQLEKIFKGADSLVDNMYTEDGAPIKLNIVKIVFEGRCRTPIQKQLYANIRKYYPEFIIDCTNQYSKVKKSEDGWLKCKCYLYGIWVGSSVRLIDLVRNPKELCVNTDFEDAHVTVNLNGEWYDDEVIPDDKIVLFTNGYDPYNDHVCAGKLFGKYVIPSNKYINNVNTRYYRLSNVIDKGDCLIADTEKVPYDYYEGINLKEFLDVLEYNEFKIGFIDQFKAHDTIEHQIFAYHLPTRMIINALTCGGKLDRIEVYCPGQKCNFEVDSLIYRQAKSMTVFNIAHYELLSNDNEGIIHILKKCMEKSVTDGSNFYKEPVSLWNYSDYQSTIEDFMEMRKKIKKANRDDMLELFKDCDEMLEALNS